VSDNIATHYLDRLVAPKLLHLISVYDFRRILRVLCVLRG